MGRGRRRFDLYTIGPADVELFGAWDGRKDVTFTYADSQHFRMIRKGNTQLFDALTDICGLPYRLSEDILHDFLYELIMVELKAEPDAPYIRVRGTGVSVAETESLLRTLYDEGFRITGVPDGEGVRTVRFVPLIAPASMARKGHYLFVNEQRLGPLLRTLTLDLVQGGEEAVPVVAEGLGKKAFISVHKLAAYIGNAYSDGRSLREMLTENAGENACRLGLHAGNTICVADSGKSVSNAKKTWFQSGMERFDYFWVSGKAARETSLPPLQESTERDAEARALERLFYALQDDAGTFQSVIPAPESGVWEVWKQQISLFFTASSRPALQLECSLMPVPQRDGQCVDLMRYCVVYAAMMADAGRPCVYLNTNEPEEEGSVLYRSWKTLLDTVERCRNNHERLRYLWNTADKTRKPESYVQGVTCLWQAEGLYTELVLAPKNYFRAELHRMQADEAVEAQLYDGVGFLSDDRFDRLQELLEGRKPGKDAEKLNAVQVRLPWCKGLLVRFTFTRFFADWAEEQGIALQDLRLKDVYDTPRRLFDEQGRPLLQALFTESMFKGAEWFFRLELEGDRWAEYWRRMEQQGIALLIAGQSTPMRQESRLNYQFVSTGGMDAAVLEEMVQEQLRQTTDAAASPDGLPGAMQRRLQEEPDELPGEPEDEPVIPPDTEDEDADEAENDGADEAAGDYQSCLNRAAEASVQVLCRTSFMQRKAKELADSELLQLMRGRLTVSGDMRYALPDLMEMCRYLAQNFLSPAVRRKMQNVQRLNDPAAEHVHGFYYAPGQDAPWMQEKCLPVAVLRNPHYAPGEEPVLQPLPDADQHAYDRYFSALTGCIMLPAAALMTLNGADCDGDRVNVCADSRVLRGLARQSARDNEILRQMIIRRNEIEVFLRQQAKDADNRDKASFMHRMAEELCHILPEQLPADETMDCCAPLMYSGDRILRSEKKNAGQGSGKYRPDQLRGGHLAGYLWDAFRQSGDQEIGMMSLRLLDLAAMAYREDNKKAAAEMTAGELLRAFWPRYLVIQSALDTALEIDMAKSGLRRADSPLKQPPAQLYGMLGLRGGESSYRQWQSLYKQRRWLLSGKDFDRNLKQLMTDYAKKRRKADDGAGALPLERLPDMAYALWRGMQTAKKEAETWRLGSVLREPDWPAGENAGEYMAKSRRLAGAMQVKIMEYHRCIRSRSSLEKHHARLSEKHVLAMRWLLGTGCPLHAAHQELDEMRGMLAEWRELLKDGDRYRAAITHISERISPDRKGTQLHDAIAAQWGWGDAAVRERMLDDFLTIGGETLPCRETLRHRMTVHPRGLMLLKHIIRYAQAEAALTVHQEPGAAYTPDALESKLQQLAQEWEGDSVLRRELYYNACRMLNLGKFDEAGKYRKTKGVLNDFLTTYLLRNELPQRLLSELPARK